MQISLFPFLLGCRRSFNIILSDGFLKKETDRQTIQITLILCIETTIYKPFKLLIR